MNPHGYDGSYHHCDGADCLGLVSPLKGWDDQGNNGSCSVNRRCRLLTEDAASALADSVVQAALDRGNKIEAIKRVRQLTGLGLKEAKDLIEAYQRNPDRVVEKKKRPVNDLSADGVRDLIEEGKLDEAVDLYRRFAGVDQYTAQDAVEKLRQEMGK